MAVKYEPAVIQESAERLYREAGRLVFAWAFRLGFLGAIAGGVGLSMAKMSGLTGAVVVGLVGALMGASYGREKGFELRLRAQEALCQLQVELNTRPAAMAQAPAVSTPAA